MVGATGLEPVTSCVGSPLSAPIVFLFRRNCIAWAGFYGVAWRQLITILITNSIGHEDTRHTAVGSHVGAIYLQRL
jgi:hypothetical protein